MSAQQSILLEPAKEVDIPAIEKELTALWKHAAEDVPSGTPSVVRACMLNLVIVTGDEGRGTGLEEIIGQVTADHPSRIFVISADRDVPPRLEAWVSARCSLPVPGGKQVCCEEINLTALGDEREKVPNIVTSLLVADIPTILLWKAPLDDRDVVFQSLMGIADRVLIDSSDERRPREVLKQWCLFVARECGTAVCGDLAWTHLAPWRELLAQAFEPRSARVHLRDLDRVSIEYSISEAPHHSGLSQSLLAVGWLARALDWIPVQLLEEGNEGSYTAGFTVDQKAISVRIDRVHEHVSMPGRIESMRLHSTRGGEIVIRTGMTADCVFIRSSLPGRPPEESHRAIHHDTEAGIVSRELEVLYNEPLYEESMAALSRTMNRR